MTQASKLFPQAALLARKFVKEFIIKNMNGINSKTTGEEGSESLIEPWYKQFWPWFLIALPGTVVIASISMFFVALNTADSLVIDNYYREGLNVNTTLEQDTLASELKLRAKISIDSSNGEVRVTLDNISVDDETKKIPLQLELLHAKNQAEDIKLILQPTPQGDWLANLPTALIGQWYIRLSNVQANKTQSISTEKSKNTLWRLQKSVFLGAADKSSSDIELIVIEASD
jgi:hypothetical protein